MDGPPLLIGILSDFPAADGGAAFEWAVRQGFDEVAESGRLPGPVHFVHQSAPGLPLPGGSAHAVEEAFRALDTAGVLAVLGPAITDNALAVRPLADQAGLACINYSGAEESRSACGFHFQLGSLEDEPSFIAAHLADRGLRRVALIQDATYIGRRKADFFEEACGSIGLKLVSRALLPAAVKDAVDAVRGARASSPDALVTLGLWDLPHAVSRALHDEQWRVPAVANSALMYGYHDPTWAVGWEGWTYADTVSEDNRRYQAFSKAAAADGRPSGPGQAAAYDMGRLLAEGLSRSRVLTRDEVVRGLERVKSLPAASGRQGTLMGFGRWDRAALKGPYLVIRQWRGGRSIEWSGV